MYCKLTKWQTHANTRDKKCPIFTNTDTNKMVKISALLDHGAILHLASDILTAVVAVIFSVAALQVSVLHPVNWHRCYPLVIHCALLICSMVSVFTALSELEPMIFLIQLYVLSSSQCSSIQDRCV